MKVQLKVTSMTCSHCNSLVNNAIVQVQPDTKVIADLPNQLVSVESTQMTEDIVTTLDEAGSPATVLLSEKSAAKG